MRVDDVGEGVDRGREPLLRDLVKRRDRLRELFPLCVVGDPGVWGVGVELCGVELV